MECAREQPKQLEIIHSRPYTQHYKIHSKWNCASASVVGSSFHVPQFHLIEIIFGSLAVLWFRVRLCMYTCMSVHVKFFCRFNSFFYFALVGTMMPGYCCAKEHCFASVYYGKANKTRACGLFISNLYREIVGKCFVCCMKKIRICVKFELRYVKCETFNAWIFWICEI